MSDFVLCLLKMLLVTAKRLTKNLYYVTTFNYSSGQDYPFLFLILYACKARTEIQAVIDYFLQISAFLLRKVARNYISLPDFHLVAAVSIGWRKFPSIFFSVEGCPYCRHVPS